MWEVYKQFMVGCEGYPLINGWLREAYMLAVRGIPVINVWFWEVYMQLMLGCERYTINGLM